MVAICLGPALELVIHGRTYFANLLTKPERMIACVFYHSPHCTAVIPEQYNVSHRAEALTTHD